MSEIANLRDKMRKEAKSDLARKVWTEDRGEVKLSAEVSPCAWLYPGHCLQVTVTMAGGGDVQVQSATQFEIGTEEEIISMMHSVGTIPCKCGCGKPAFDPKTVRTNRNGECESCFMAKINAKFDEIEQNRLAEVDENDKRYKARGYTHRVDGWVHSGAGDDLPITFYTKDPSKALIQAELKKAGSKVINDYQVTKL